MAFANESSFLSVGDLKHALGDIFESTGEHSAPSKADRWKVARDVAQDFRLERCLRTEVNNLLVRSQALAPSRSSLVGNGETQDERLDRFESFFSEFRASGSKAPLPQRLFDFDGGAESGSECSSPSGSRPASPKGRRMPMPVFSSDSRNRITSRLSSSETVLGNAHLLVGGGKASKLARKGLNWKERAGKSRRSAGAWGLAGLQRELQKDAALKHSSSDSCLVSNAEDWRKNGVPRHCSVARRLVSLDSGAIQAANLAMPENSVAEDPLQFRVFNRAVRRACSGTYPPLSMMDAKVACSQDQRSLPSSVSSVVSGLDGCTERSADSTVAELPPLQLRGNANASKLQIMHKGSYWDPAYELADEQCLAPHARRYLEECMESHIVPQTVPFTTGHSKRLFASNRNLLDRDLRTMLSAMERGGFDVNAIDLSDNPMLTDKTLVPLLQAIVQPRAKMSLDSLNLMQCRGVGSRTIERLVDLLNFQAGKSLTYFNISGIRLSQLRQEDLCTAIGNHRALKSLFLADTGLSSESVAVILGNVQVETLDLGWNCFSSEAFSIMGDLLDGPSKMRALSLANTSAACARDGGDGPLVYLLERLAGNEGLTQLDISLNRLDYRAALVLEDAFCTHRTLAELNISQNPLGILGIRSMLRLLADNGSSLRNFTWENCASDIDRNLNGRCAIFNSTFPGGRYMLNLETPYGRAFMRMLCKTSERHGLSVQDVFADVSATDGPYETPAKGQYGRWTVQSCGKLSFMFSIERRLNRGDKKEKWAFGKLLRQYLERARIKPGFRNLIHVLGMWQRMKAHTREQQMMLGALVGEFRLSPFHVRQLARNREIGADVIWQFLPCIEGEERGRFLTLTASPTPRSYVSALQKARNFLFVNFDNPTGHYRLDLSNPTDVATAGQLLLLDRWEAKLAHDLKRADASQRGNESCFLNEVYQEAAFKEASVRAWTLPEHGVLEFDYATGFRQRRKAATIDDAKLDSIIEALTSSSCSPDMQVIALRTHAHLLTLRSLQLRRLLGTFSSELLRAEIYVLLFFRVVDMENEKIFRARLADTRREYAALQRRLGHASSFPYLQPENYRFSFDLRFNDQRLAAHAIFQLCAAENADNLKDLTYEPVSGGVDANTFWTLAKEAKTVDKMPVEGVVGGLYTCASGNRNLKERLRLLETFGFWSPDIPESSIRWWSSLQEAPRDVLVLVEWLLPRYSDVPVAFDDLQSHVPSPGVATSGVLVGKEFESGLLALGCNRFAGSDERQRISGVFKYLDMAGEGAVSQVAWSALGPVCEEARLVIAELVAFFMKISKGDPALWWQALLKNCRSRNANADGLDFDAWKDACKSLGYSGDVRQAFMFADKDGGGRISADGLQALQRCSLPVQQSGPPA
eukprot:TRINITY_DN13105_c1_g1_i1.p1 TRINITY_DN13105_c1_g1~~TRINITY_DN13105_c1_g1_i1.p1  ORF type:complete len:1382 (+),score=161.67 TRINITY_DN13105_c1_g1_i1:110-4255(+)